MRLLSLFADRLRAALDGSVRAGLAPYVAEREALRAELDALRLGITALGRDREALDRWLSRRTGPFTGDMTVHEAWARHPRAKEVFARHHLPACPACAVGADETLAEAAFGYRLSLEDLLGELNAVLRPS